MKKIPFVAIEYLLIAILRLTNIQHGATKSDQFSANQNELAGLFKALAHPARIAIVEFLLKTESCICGDIVNELPLSQPTVSQHLKEMKNAGLIKGNVEGTAICYCLDAETFAKIGITISVICDTLSCKNGNSCC